MNGMRSLLLVSIALICSAVQAEEDAPVTPYRPTASNPAQLPVAGQLELEMGGLSSKDEGLRRDSLPYLFKLGFNEKWGVLIGGEARVSAQNADGTRDTSVGDTTLVLKRAFLMDDATAYGIELGAKMPTANDAIGSGKSDYMLNAIFSKDIARFHVDANFNVTMLGLEEDHASRAQTGISASLSAPINQKWGAMAELSEVYRRGDPDTGQLLLAGTYSPSKRMVIDFGIAKGLTHASQDWSVFGGLVIPVAKLF